MTVVVLTLSLPVQCGESLLKTRAFELLEEIEAATSEIHVRTLKPSRSSDNLANEAARIAAEGEQIVARDIERNPERVCRNLVCRRDRLRAMLEESPV